MCPRHVLTLLDLLQKLYGGCYSYFFLVNVCAYLHSAFDCIQCSIHQAKRPQLSALQSQTLSATSFVADIAAIAGESDVDIGEVRQSPAKVFVQDNCLLA